MAGRILKSGSGGDERVFFDEDGLAVALFEMEDRVKSLLEGVVVADDEELIEAAHSADLLGEIAAALAVHILRRLIEEGDVEAGEAAQQRETHGQRRAHLLAAAELGEAALL